MDCVAGPEWILVVYSYIRVLPDEFLLESTQMMTTDFKKIIRQTERKNINMHPPPPNWRSIYGPEGVDKKTLSKL